MTKFILISVLISILASCSNAPELETGEIKILEIFNRALKQSNQSKQFMLFKRALSNGYKLEMELIKNENFQPESIFSGSN